MLFVHLKLHQAPYEWVYDGLAPLRLVDVVERKKGLGFVLGTVAVAGSVMGGVRGGVRGDVMGGVMGVCDWCILDKEECDVHTLRPTMPPTLSHPTTLSTPPHLLHTPPQSHHTHTHTHTQWVHT